MHVLLVEDNAKVSAQLEAALTKAGFHVTTAINGLDGYNKAQKNAFDVCVVDHLMPLMDGRQLLKNLAGLHQYKPTYLVFMSTQEVKVVEQIPEVEFADTIISKPISDDDFISVMTSLIDQSTLKHSTEVA